MYKLKTVKAVKKRFKVTSKGKLLKSRPYRSHLLQKKNSKRKQQLRKVLLVSSRDISNFILALPYIN
uniref:50S ribosomal protein L35 n=1 Tax=Bornetia secundiflora TaxID=2575637 RepID=A0A4D6WQ29_9FLOR|nr:ribosomal protein L35 [Bornetia secundiflora]